MTKDELFKLKMEIIKDFWGDVEPTAFGLQRSVSKLEQLLDHYALNFVTSVVPAKIRNLRHRGGDTYDDYCLTCQSFGSACLCISYDECVDDCLANIKRLSS